jgi:SAM-dependent methyltransferase
VSWYQPVPVVSLELIDTLEVRRDAAVLDVGGGGSHLADELVARGFTDLTVVDLSEAALDATRGRLPADAPVRCVQVDVLEWTPDRRFELWHDRAVFHFLVDERDRRRYLGAVRDALSPGGAVVVGTFAPDGPPTCSGLPVDRYSPDELAAELGEPFEVVAVRREEHVTPRGVVQPFTWVAGRL